MILFLLLQAAAPAPALPDIELNIRARARSVEIQQKGEAKLEVRADPDAGSVVEARVEPEGRGAAKLRNVQVNVRGEARIGGGTEIRADAETGTPR